MTYALYNYYNDDIFMAVFGSMDDLAAWLKRTKASTKASVSMIQAKKIDNSIYTPNGRAKIYIYNN